MISTNTFKSFLEHEFQRRKLANPAYSLRAFSRKIGLSPSSFSEFRRGKRNLSPDSTRKILLSLGMSSSNTDEMLEGLYRKKFIKNKRLQPTQKALDENTFNIISDWKHFAILSCLECEGREWNAKAISEKLSLSEADTQECLDRLFEVGMLHRLSNNIFITTGKSYISPDDVSSEAIQKYQESILNFAVKRLKSDPVSKRDFFTTTLAIDPKKLPQAKKMIREFHKKLSKFLEHGSQSEVFSFSSQMWGF